MELKAIISGIEGLKAKGNLDLDIKSIECDSRKVEKDGMFIAIKGFQADGHEYIKNAIENGAKVVMVQEDAKLNKQDFTDDVTIIVAPNTRIALAKVACNFYKNPSRKMKWTKSRLNRNSGKLYRRKKLRGKFKNYTRKFRTTKIIL